MGTNLKIMPAQTDKAAKTNDCVRRGEALYEGCLPGIKGGVGRGEMAIGL